MMTGVAETLALIAAKIGVAATSRPSKKRVVSATVIDDVLTGSIVVIAGRPVQTAVTGPAMIAEAVNDVAGRTVETDKGNLVSQPEPAVHLNFEMIVEIADRLETVVARDKQPALTKAAAVEKSRLGAQMSEPLLAEVTRNLAHGHDLRALNLVPVVTQAVVVIAQAVLTAV